MVPMLSHLCEILKQPVLPTVALKERVGHKHVKEKIKISSVMHCNYICRCCKAPTISFMRRLRFCQRGPGGSMSQVVGSNNSYKPITNTALVRARLCRLQKGCTRLAAASDKDYQLLAHGRWFSPGTLASSTTTKMVAMIQLKYGLVVWIGFLLHY